MHVCGGQRTTYRSWFSSAMWVPEIKLKFDLGGLGTASSHVLSRLISPVRITFCFTWSAFLTLGHHSEFLSTCRVSLWFIPNALCQGLLINHRVNVISLFTSLQLISTAHQSLSGIHSLKSPAEEPLFRKSHWLHPVSPCSICEENWATWNRALRKCPSWNMGQVTVFPRLWLFLTATAPSMKNSLRSVLKYVS